MSQEVTSSGQCFEEEPPAAVIMKNVDIPGKNMRKIISLISITNSIKMDIVVRGFPFS